MRLKPPELVILFEFGEMVADASLPAFVATRLVELIESRLAEGFQLRPADSCVLRQRPRRQIDRDARVAPHGRERLKLGKRRNVDVEHRRSL
jgi:hypothetical protein